MKRTIQLAQMTFLRLSVIWAATSLLLVLSAPISAEERRYAAFVTESSFKGDFGGLKQADDICQGESEKENAIVPNGRYLAWLSDSEAEPLTRFTRYEHAIVLPDGTEIAGSFDDLIDGSLSQPISMDASGKSVGAQTVWTGTNADGSRAGSSGRCRDWTASSGRGLYGSTNAIDPTWSSFQVRKCHHRKKLLCFQQ